MSNTGAATVKTTASLKIGYKIFGDAPAIVDGALLANIYEGGVSFAGHRNKSCRYMTWERTSPSKECAWIAARRTRIIR